MWQGPKGKMALMRIACPSPKRWGYVASGYCFLYSDRQSDWLRYSAGLKHWVYYPGAGLPRAWGSMPRFSLEGKGQPPTPLSPSLPLSPPLLHPRPLGIWKILWFPCSFLQLSFSWNFWQFSENCPPSKSNQPSPQDVRAKVRSKRPKSGFWLCVRGLKKGK